MKSAYFASLSGVNYVDFVNSPNYRVIIDATKVDLTEGLQFFAAYALVKQRIRSEHAMSILLQLLQKNNNIYDVYLVSKLGPAAAEALPVLHGMMKRTDATASFRQVVSEAIGKIGTGPSVRKKAGQTSTAGPESGGVDDRLQYRR